MRVDTNHNAQDQDQKQFPKTSPATSRKQTRKDIECFVLSFSFRLPPCNKSKDFLEILSISIPKKASMTFGQINYIWNVRRTVSLLLLSIFLYNIIGYYFSFSVLDLQNRYEMSRLVRNEKNLQTIRIHQSEIKNIVFGEDEKEMSYNGEMYDIKDRSQDGDCMVFHCMNDKNETKLLTNLDKHIQNNIDTKSSSEKKQNSFSKNPIKDLFCMKQNVLVSDFSFFAFPTVNCKLQTVNLPFLSPPPQQA